MDRTYYLMKEVHVCVGRDYAVFLEATYGNYSALDKDAQRLIATDIAGWPAMDKIQLNEKEELEREELLEGMIQGGLLTTDSEKGKNAISARVEPVEFSFGTETSAGNRPGILAALAFQAAQRKCEKSLKLHTLGEVIEKLRARRDSSTHFSHEDAVAEIAKLLGPHLRGDTLSRLGEGDSLRRCVTFLNYLSRFKLYPKLVFGFRMLPFESYCWLQHEKTVFFEDLDIVRSFVPILAV